jgi:DNA-binding NarL/FixJ family response regulator
MLNSPCQVLLVEDEPADRYKIQNMLDDVESAFFKRGFELTCAETLKVAKQILSETKFDVILLDLLLPDSRKINNLQQLQAINPKIPIIVQTALEDEMVAVKALELGACGYLPKVASDRDLLLYAMRSAIERSQQLANIQQLPPDREIDVLENLLTDATDLKSTEGSSLKEKTPDIFTEIHQKYTRLLDRFVEQKIYQVEYTISEQIDVLIEQLGYLQATPRDLIELHMSVIKQKQSISKKKSQAFIVEGRYLLLELMGKLAAYYRRYYIGLNRLNLTNNSYRGDRL